MPRCSFLEVLTLREPSSAGCFSAASTNRLSLTSTILTLPTNRVLIDDRILVAYLLDGSVNIPRGSKLHTTAYWYYRACRAAIAGGAGQLSGPFRALHSDEQAQAIQSLLQLPESIGLPGSRQLVPEMAEISRRHPQLNLINIEAAAAARLIPARVLLSPSAARGILAGVLEREGIDCEIIQPA
jgi:hypothetical protein